MNIVLTKTYDAPPVSKKAIFRYASCPRDEQDVAALIDSCMEEGAPSLSYKVCYTVAELSVSGDVCRIGELSFKSKSLAKNLGGCERAVIFGATLGVGIDRLISKYGQISPSRALIFQAFGAERIEALCDAFCADVADGAKTRPRFSPGYGDLALETQRDIFALLNCQKNIGLFLLDSYLMSPSKSVTAIMGIEKKEL